MMLDENTRYRMIQHIITFWIHDNTLTTHDDTWQQTIRHYTIIHDAWWYVTILQWQSGQWVEHHVGSLTANKFESKELFIHKRAMFHIPVTLPYGRYDLILGCLMIWKYEMCLSLSISLSLSLSLSLSCDLQPPQIRICCLHSTP